MGGPTEGRPGGVHPEPSRRTRLIKRASAVDPLRTVMVSWWLALVAIWILQQAHDGVHEAHDLPPLLHLFRDAALAVPLAALAAVAATLLLAPRLTRVSPGARAGMADRDRFAWVLVTTAFFAVLSVPGAQFHGALFGVEQVQLGWALHALLDASIAAIGAFIALLPIALVAGPPVRRPESVEINAATAPAPSLIARSAR
jgi:hypothetical protein